MSKSKKQKNSGQSKEPNVIFSQGNSESTLDIEDNEQFKIRLGKRQTLIETKDFPYKDRFERTHRLHEAAQLPDETAEVSIAGRLISFRSFGKLIFGHIQDIEGRLQIAVEKRRVGTESFTFFKKMVDMGDFIGCHGSIFTTRTGEKTLAVESYKLLSKALRPLPEKWHGLTDPELRQRQRYLDLVIDRQGGRRFFLRSTLLKLLRHFMDQNGFVEVETPILQAKPSGALAVPFETWHRALGIPCYLRIAPETYLKRCIAAGFDRVYELGRCFRNEGMDPSHLQDFTMLEYYAAYWNYQDNMDFTERLVRHIVKKITGDLKLTHKGILIDFSGAWPRKSLRELILDYSNIDIDQCKSRQELLDQVKEKNIELEGTEKAGWGKVVDLLYKKVVRPHLINPIFIMHHPLELSPLARTNDHIPVISDRFQLIINGWEIVNAYSELIDPVDQRQRFEEQARLKAEGDDEAMPMDEDFLRCMEHGMPPISGWGMGIDRMVSLLTDQENLRETILFPLMKPRKD